MFTSVEKVSNVNLALTLDSLGRTLRTDHVLITPPHSSTKPVSILTIRDFRPNSLEAEKRYRHDYHRSENANINFTGLHLSKALNAPAKVHIIDRTSDAGRYATINLFDPSTTSLGYLTIHQFDGAAEDSVDFRPQNEPWMYTQDTIDPESLKWTAFFASLTNSNSQLLVVGINVDPNGSQIARFHQYSTTYTTHTTTPDHNTFY